MNSKSLLTLFNNLRYSAGIAMLFNGFPIIFFIRDTLHIGPASNVFSAVFFGFALLLMMPAHLFVRLYKPNLILLKYAALFLGLSLYHFFVFNNTGLDTFVELGNYVITLVFLFLIIHVPNQVKDTLVPILFIFAFFSNLTLIYSLLTDPNWKIGMRAAVTFENSNAQEGGNPHVAARNGLVSLLTGLVLIWQFKNILIRTFLVASLVLSIAVLVLAQVKSSLLAVGLMIGIFFLVNANFTSAVKIARKVFTLKNLVYSLIFYFVLNIILRRYNDLYGMLYGYWYGFETKIMDVLFTAFGVKLTETAGIDASAMGRVTSFSFLSNAIYNPELILIGIGYKASFMDVPLVEALINHGILGLIFFGGLNFYLFIFTIKELRNPTNPLTLFLAYFFIYFLVLLISNGRPYDVSFWFPYVLMIRFLGIKFIDSPIESTKQYSTQTV